MDGATRAFSYRAKITAEGKKSSASSRGEVKTPSTFGFLFYKNCGRVSSTKERW